MIYTNLFIIKKIYMYYAAELTEDDCFIAIVITMLFTITFECLRYTLVIQACKVGLRTFLEI